jgi:uncharacterized repeat protein (TIGR01451 family)
MKTLLRSMMIICMLAAMLTVAPAPASAQDMGAQVGMPEGLQEAILSSTVHAFLEGGGKYSTSSNGLDFELSATGLQSVGQGLQWGIALQGFGRGTQILDVSAPKMSQVGGRLEYQRGMLTEWYRDTVLGVEQGFTISKSPMGEDQLVLQFNVTTDLQGKLDKNERGLSFRGADGQTLRYDQLKVHDANGAELDARMVYTPGQVQILVDDRGAAYPITIDPIIYLEQKVIASDGNMEDNFGSAVAISGNTAIVGTPGDDVDGTNRQGSAYIFVRSGSTWSQQARLNASDGAENDNFGYSVALSGDTALIGAIVVDVGANVDQGSAYVFTRSGTTWVEEAKLTASDGSSGDWFGYSVALSGDTALVGVNKDDVGANVDQGSAYVFTRSWTTWTQQTQLTASDGEEGDEFGKSVALSGETALVGAWLDDLPFYTSPGSAYVFTRSGTTWSQQAQLAASDGASSDFFGYSVALSGDTALVGAYVDDVGANSDQGSAYVFTRSGTSWNQQGQLIASDGATHDQFGNSVALSGDTALVGAHYDYGGGSAYVFIRDGTTWSEQTQMTASDTALDGIFGNSVALSGDTALVGSYYDDVGGNIDQGSAYFYHAYRTDSDLAISAARGVSGSLLPGETVLLTTTVMNYGPSSAHSVLMNVALPSGLTYVSHAVTRGTYTPSTNSWNAGTLTTGISATLVITATVNSIPDQTLTFSPYLLGQDINDANNAASINLPIITPHEIALNGGFNIYGGTSKIPTNWTARNFTTTDGKITSVKKEGTASVRITNTSAITKTLSQTLDLSGSSGDRFYFSFWARGVSIPVMGICRGQVLLYNGTTLKMSKAVNCTKDTYGFQQRSLYFTAISAYTKIVITLTYAKASGTIYFDGLSLLKAP